MENHQQGPFAILTKQDAGGRMLRRLLPAIILVPPGLGWLRMIGEEQGLYSHTAGVVILVIAVIGILALLAVSSAISLSKSEQKLQDLNLSLENTINQRVAELKESEKQIQHLQKMDSIGRLAGGLAHDFNNLLGAVQMYCDLIYDQTNEDPVKKFVDQIRKASDRGALLTQQLLFFSRQQVSHFVNFDLNDLIDNQLQMLNRVIQENIKIVPKFAPDLPEIKADRSQIEQVIMNLVINARDAMPDGGKITIETSLHYLSDDFTSTHLTVASGPCVLLTITDTGEGMDAGTQSQIFDPFFTTKTQGKGVGLGLSTSYGIIKASKATIWVYSELGKGTVFKIYFPVSNYGYVAPVVEEKMSVSKEAKTILLVEDEEVMRSLFEMILKRQGYTILIASNGGEALNVLENHKGSVDLLLTDVIMPGIGGIELSKKILLMMPHLKVIYMSGYTNDSIDMPANSNKISFIQKPFNSQALTLKVKNFLNPGQEYE